MAATSASASLAAHYAASTRPADAPVPNAAYTARARAVAERRIALGGYRLAALLKAELAPD